MSSTNHLFDVTSSTFVIHFLVDPIAVGTYSCENHWVFPKSNGSNDSFKIFWIQVITLSRALTHHHNQNIDWQFQFELLPNAKVRQGLPI